MLAEKLGIDPLDFRRMNSLKPGQTKATGMIADQWPFPELSDAIRPHYLRAKKEAAAFNAKGGPLKRGVGLGAHSFGIGDPGDAAKLYVEVDPDDGVTIYAAVADPGEGNDSLLTQVAADRLALPVEKVRLFTRDTDKTLDEGGSWGSRQTLMAPNALINAIEQLEKAMREAGSRTYAGLTKAGKPTRYEGSTKNSTKSKFGFHPQTGQADSYLTECHNIQLAEVEVDTNTGRVRVIKMTSAVDAGIIIHPQNFEGQLEGGLDQGVGYALREEYIHGETTDYVTFKFPTIRDSFDIEVVTRETPRSKSAIGATGVGEMTMVPTAPAVINAIKDACGIRIYDIPATPTKISAALDGLAK
jgi:aldehyde oxidoreductase